METWVRFMAKRIAIAATCVVMLAGLVMQLSPWLLVLRGVVVGLAIYLALRIMGYLIGQALIRMLAEAALRREDNQAMAEPAGEDDEDGIPGGPSLSAIRTAVAVAEANDENPSEETVDSTAATDRSAAA